MRPTSTITLTTLLVIAPIILVSLVATSVLATTESSSLSSASSDEESTTSPTTTTPRPTRPPRKPIANYESYVNKILEDSTERMKFIYELKCTKFNNSAKRTTQTKIKENVNNLYHNLVYELAANLSIVPINDLTNPILRRQVQRLSKLQLHGLNKDDYETANEILDKFHKFIREGTICYGPLTQVDNCLKKMPMIPNIVNHVIFTKKIADLEIYWRKWRQALDNQNASNKFTEYVELLRTASRYNGHVTPSRTWYLYYDTDNFQSEMEDVVWEIMPLYKQLHAYIRHSARKFYGNRITSSDGAMPAHVMEQIIHQAWHPNTTFDQPYPNSPLPNFHTRLGEILITPLKLINKTTVFFDSLGLNYLSKNLTGVYVHLNREDTGSDCKSEVYYFPPYVGLRYCQRLDYKKMMQMHGNVAELQYNIYRTHLPIGLDQEPCPGFSSAIAEAAVIASGTPRHLCKLRILDRHDLSEERVLNRLFHMAIHTILAIPQYFIYDKYLVDVMDGRIGYHELNCGYWKLQYKYAGVVPPIQRNERYFDPDYKFYRGLNPEKSNTMKFVTEVLGFQFYRAFCIATDQYRPGNPEYPLSNCDFSGNVDKVTNATRCSSEADGGDEVSKKAGELIKKMMQAGATKHWRDVLEIGTGERKLNAKALMEYFAPLYAWLKQQNEFLDLEVGWDADLRCGKQ